MKVIWWRLCYLAVIACFLVLSPFGDIHAFDGKHKGFFFGIGLEPGISVVRTIYDGEDSYLYGSPSLTTNFKIGYGFSEQLLIYLISRSSLNGFYRYYDFQDGYFYESDIFFIDGTYGLGLTFFPNRNGNFYFSGCFGFATGMDIDDFPVKNLLENMVTGLGVSGGIGYEIFPNLAVSITLDYRRFADTYYTTDVITLSLGVNVFLY